MSGTHLTTSRINRVLRPLRTKCDKLASISSSSNVRVTYSTRTRSNSTVNNHTDDTPPLATLQPPETLQYKLQLDTNSRKHLELSRNIYAVRDAFRNVVQVAFGPMTSDRRNSVVSSFGPTNVLSLSALCCVVVGLELGNDHEIPLDEDKDEEGSGREETGEGSSWMDELYDEIPFHFRKWTLVTHALQVILRTCPHHPTLLVCLLDLCLSQPQQYPLISHCESLLWALLQVALTSPSNPNAVSPLPPPICHTAHVSYLVDLKGKWCKANFGNERNFVGMLLRILLVASSEAWTSKAVTKLARVVANEDFTCLIRMTLGLVEVIAKSRSGKSKLDRRPNGRKLDLLLQWCQSIFDHLMFTPKVDEDEDVCLTVLELTVTYFESRQPFGLLPSSELDDIMTCIVTWCLASLPSSFSDRDLDNVVNILAVSNPSRAVYSSLVSRIFSLASEDDVPAESFEEIRSFARTLRYNRLFWLEILFINQTSTYFEKTFMMTLGHEPEFEEIIEELAKSLAEAEAEMRYNGCGHEDEFSDGVSSADGQEPCSPMPAKKKRNRLDYGDDFRHFKPKRRRCDEGLFSSLHARSRPTKQQSSCIDGGPIDISDSDLESWETRNTRSFVRKIKYDNLDQTPEVQVEEEGDDYRDDQLTISLQTSSSDDLLDLFACPDTSPVAVRCRNR